MVILKDISSTIISLPATCQLFNTYMITFNKHNDSNENNLLVLFTSIWGWDKQGLYKLWTYLKTFKADTNTT